MSISWKTCARVGISAFLLFLCIEYWKHLAHFVTLLVGASTPILIGLSIAYVLNILMSFYEKHYFVQYAQYPIVKKSKRIVCMLAALLSFCGLLALVIWLVIPELVSCVSFLLSEIPPAIQRLFSSEWVVKLLPSDLHEQLMAIDWMGYAAKLVQLVTTGIGSAVTTVITALTSVFSVVVTTLLSVIFAIYLLMSKDKLLQQSNRLLHTYLRPQWEQKLMHWLSVLNDCFHRYIVGQCTEAVILGGLCTAGMFLLRFPYAAMIGTLVGFTALIPVAGSYIGAGVGAIMIVTVSPVKALFFLLFIVILQQLEGNLIYPKVVGKSIGLPSVLVLAAVTIGGSLMGVLGMLIGVPLAAAFYRLLRENVYKREATDSTVLL